MLDEIKRPEIEQVIIRLKDFVKACKVRKGDLSMYFDDKGMLSNDFSKIIFNELKDEATYYLKCELYKHELDVDECLNIILSNYTYEVDARGLFEPIYYWKVFQVGKEKLLNLDEFSDYCRTHKLFISQSVDGYERKLTSIITGQEVASAILTMIPRNEIRFIYKPKCVGLRDFVLDIAPKNLRMFGEE